MNILGITAFVHDSAASLIKDGDLVANVEEERLNRQKHTNEFPKKSIEYVLEEGKIKIGDVDIIAFNWDPYKSLRSEVFKLFLLPIYYKVLKHNKPPKNFKSIWKTFFLKRHVRNIFGNDFKGKIVWVSHHLSHAASTFYLSPFESADIYTIDGHGENTSISFFKGSKKGIFLEWGLPIRHSLGVLYSNFTHFLGFGEWQEGKTMALASYGQNTYKSFFEKLISLKPDGKYTINVPLALGLWSYKNGLFEEDIGVYRTKGSLLTQEHMNIAKSMQERIKETVLHVLKNNQKESENENCCMAGGVFLNCDINKDIEHSGIYKKYFIPPFTSDTGGAAGAALYAAFSLGYEKKPLVRKRFSPFLGPSYSDVEILEAIAAAGLDYKYTKTPWKQAGQAISDQRLIGWFQGRVESGPRALGNRSILANPCNENIKAILNEKIKLREYFRPFAPIVTKKEALRCFELGEPIPEISHYMLLTVMVRDEFREKLAGITHVDGTARIQVVRPEWSPETYQLLLEVERLYGFGVMINTSFNRHEPIVCSPKDAIKTFTLTGLDMLVMGNYILEK